MQQRQLELVAGLPISSWLSEPGAPSATNRAIYIPFVRTEKHTERVDKQVFTGGLRTSSGFNATIPFARLTVAEEGMTLRLFGFVYARRDWSEVRSAQRVVGGLLGSPGVRIALRDGKQFVFWSFNPQLVLDTLSDRGVSTVDPGAKPPKVWLGS